MNKLVMGFVAAVMVLLTVAGASAFNFSINGSGIGVNPPVITTTLSDFFTTYHLDGNPAVSRNSVAPGYEYQFAGETIHFDAHTASSSIFGPSNVVVRITCANTSGIVTIDQPLVMTSAPSGSGPYTSSWASDYVIPEGTAVSGDCNLSVRMRSTPTSAWTADPLTSSLYASVNEILMNPTINVNVAAFNFNNNNPAQTTPSPVLIQVTTPKDNDGQGTLGNLTFSMDQFCGTTPAYCFRASVVEYSTTGAPSSYKYFVDRSSSTWSDAFLGNINTNVPANINLYMLLHMPGIAPPQTYSSSWSMLYQIL